MDTISILANYPTKGVHISTIKAGDTIMFDGQLTTVCENNIKIGFCGVTLFGDSFMSGALPVTKILINKVVR